MVVWRLLRIGHEEESNFTLSSNSQGEIAIGRRKNSELRIEGDYISRDHAKLVHHHQENTNYGFYEEEDYWILEDHSRYGTYVNGYKHMNSKVLLDDGDVISFGRNLTESECKNSKTRFMYRIVKGDSY